MDIIERVLLLISLAGMVFASPFYRDSVKHSIDMNPATHPSLRNDVLKIDVNIDEFIEITCPQYSEWTPRENVLQFRLFDMHEWDSFQSCDFKRKQPVLSCDNPYFPTKLTMKIQKISPYPLGFTFQEGKTYYYTAIPLGDENCKDAMRLVVDVQRKDVIVPPLYKVEEKPPTLPTTSTTTSTTTVKSTKKVVVTPGKTYRSTTTNGSTHATRTLSIIVLLSLMGSWMNW